MGERILELTEGRGADVCLDPVGGALFEASLRAIAPCGRVLVIGFTTGRSPAARADVLLVKAVPVIGVDYGRYPRHSPIEARGRLPQWIERGRSPPRVQARYRFESAVDALLALTSRTVTRKCAISP